MEYMIIMIYLSFIFYSLILKVLVVHKRAKVSWDQVSQIIV